VDINLIPFPMIDHIDILKDGASAVYGSDAVAGVINIFLLHKFRGLEIGGSYGNTNLGASNDARELEGWLKAGAGDDKTDIVVIADFYDRAAIYSRDRDISANAFAIPWGGFDNRSGTFSGVIGPFRLIPRLFFSANSPPPHSAPNAATSPFYKKPGFPTQILAGLPVVNPNAYPGPPGIIGPHAGQHVPQTLGTYGYKGGGDYFLYNFAAVAPAIPAADRQSFYGSFTRDICDKYLTVFADFKCTRSFFDAALAATPFNGDPFKGPNGLPFHPGSLTVPLQNAFNPFTAANATLIYNGVPVPVTTGVSYRALNDEPLRTDKTTFHDVLFDTGLRGEMGEFGDYFKSWNWELGFRYSQNDEELLFGGVVSRSGLREALLDTNPATAFNPFLGIFGRNSNAAISRVYVDLHQSGEFELPLGYFTINGDVFNLPAGPVSFAAGAEYRGERWKNNPDSDSTTFDDLGFINIEASRVNRDVWATYQEVRFPVTSPLWNFPGAYSLEFDIAEREEWYSQNTSAAPPVLALAFVPAGHSTYNAQKPKFSVRWEPLDPKWIGAVILRGSYSEAFHAPTLPDLTPAGTQGVGEFHDPRGLTPLGTSIPVLQSGNPNLKPEVAYEWTYGAVYSPKWIKGLTLSADFWHIDLRSIASFVDPQFIIDFENSFPGLVIRNPTTGAITEVRNPSLNLTRAIVEGVDYEEIYILDSSMFGHGDLGRWTFTLNGTYLSRFEFQPTPVSKRIGLSGEFVTGASFTGSLPHNRAYASAFYDGPADTWLAGFDIGATVHYTGQYEDDNVDLTSGPNLAAKPQTPRSGEFPWRARKVREWTTLDLIASYTFNLPPPASGAVPGLAKDGGKNVKIKDGNEKNVLPVSTAEYNPCGWRAWLNNTTISLGMQNVFDSDPPFVAGSGGDESNYDQSVATIKGRFWYLQLKKRF